MLNTNNNSITVNNNNNNASEGSNSNSNRSKYNVRVGLISNTSHYNSKYSSNYTISNDNV